MTSLPPLLPARAGAPDVVAFGENSLDFIGVVDELSMAPATKRRLATFDVLPGGQMATAAAGCAALGCRARYVGVFGDDEPGRASRAALAARGVDVIAIERRAVPSRTAIVLVDRASGDRLVFEHRDARLKVSETELPLERLVDGRVLMLDATDPAASLRAARAARAAGVRTVVDVDRVAPDVDALLAEIDVVVVPDQFIRTSTAEESLDLAFAKLDRRFPGRTLVVTKGREGVEALVEGRRFSVPGHVRPEIPVVDTTGAGDAFRAGFVAKWLKDGAKARIQDVLAYANAAAYLNCRARGAQSGLPTDSEVCDLLTTAHGRQSK